MHAEIIAIGDEIISGEHLDTNSPWLSQRLEEFGVRVHYISAVRDELEPCTDVFRRAIQRADIVIATGGLGPTADDLTRDALAQAADRQLELYPQALDHIRSLFAWRKREMPRQNELQAMLPAGSRMIFNPHGTAPGIDMEVPRPGKYPCRFFALPGVPAEMIEMWNGTLAREIRTLAAGQNVIRRHKINCFGAGESQIETMLPDLIRRGHSPTVGITASKTTVSLRITAEATTEEACNALIEPTAATIQKCLGPLVFGFGDDELQHVVLRQLREQNKTLTTVELGTAGLLADWLGGVTDDKDCYLGGLVVNNHETLARLLNLRIGDIYSPLPLGEGPGVRAFLNEYEVISESLEIAATACRQVFKSDYALAVGPFPDENLENPKLVHLALAKSDDVITKSIPFAGHPATLRIYIAKHALNLLRLKMLD